MKTKITLRDVVFLILAVAIAAGMCVFAFASGGMKEDPIVTLSYLEGPYRETLRQAVMDDIDEKFCDDLKIQLEREIRENVSEIVNPPDTYTVIQLNVGDKLESTGCTECILRSGRARAFVESALNRKEGLGISDSTASKEITDGQYLTANHYLIIPRGDGRGVVAENEVFIMAKGEYRVIRVGE